jgi:LysR family transcriptional regulator, low CO2-responsive transcriptional regulator
MHITLRHLRIFESVARHTSISRAAAEVHLTQPAVSMQMKQLEEQIGVPLLEQIGKRLYLTEAGAELRGHAARIAAQMVELNVAMDQFRDLERGLLRLAVVSTANYFVPRLLARYGELHPGVRVSLQVANRERVLAALADNHTDLAITGQPPDIADVVAQHFMDNPLVVIASPSHPLAALDSVSLEQLDQATLVVREPGSGTRQTMDRHFAEQGIGYQPGCELGTNEAIKQAVQAGLGLAVVSLQTIELELETRRLVVLPAESFPITRHWYVVHRSHRRLSAATQAFRSLLLAHDPAVPVVAKRRKTAA